MALLTGANPLLSPSVVEGSEWLVQLSSLLQRSGAVVDLTDLLGASVMLLLEDGWDFTAQVGS